MTIKSYLYLDRNQQTVYIKELKINKDIFEKIKTVLSENPELDANEYAKERWNYICVNPDFDDEGYPLDPTDSLIKLETDAFEKFQFLKNAKYRVISMWICCTWIIWEQQIINYLNRQICIGALNYNVYRKEAKQKLKECKCDIGNEANEKKVLFENGFDTPYKKYKPIDSFDNDTETMLKKYNINIPDKIHEFKLLVNVLKHSKGCSEKCLREIRPDLFNLNGHDYIETYNSSLKIVSLNLSEMDFDIYNNALIEFWENFPVDTHIYENK